MRLREAGGTLKGDPMVGSTAKQRHLLPACTAVFLLAPSKNTSMSGWY